MSWRHVQAAGLLPIARPPVKAVLLTLAHHANDFTGQCWPDVERIMLFTGLSRRAVQGALRELEQNEFISTSIGGRGRASLYTMQLPGIEPVEQGARAAPHSAPPAPKGAPPAPQREGNTQGIETRGSPSHLQPLPDDWKPSESAMNWAAKHYSHINLTHETAMFKDMSAKKGELYADANAAWKVWIRRTDQLRGSASGRRSAGPSAGGDALRQAAARSRG